MIRITWNGVVVVVVACVAMKAPQCSGNIHMTRPTIIDHLTVALLQRTGYRGIVIALNCSALSSKHRDRS